MFIQKWHAHMYNVFYFKSFIKDLTEGCISLSSDFKLKNYSYSGYLRSRTKKSLKQVLIALKIFVNL